MAHVSHAPKVCVLVSQGHLKRLRQNINSLLSLEGFMILDLFYEVPQGYQFNSTAWRKTSMLLPCFLPSTLSLYYH